MGKMLVCDWPRLFLESNWESGASTVGSEKGVSAVKNVPDFESGSEEAMDWWRARVMVRW